MKIYEIIVDKKTNIKKIIINYPENKIFLKSLRGAIYYANTNSYSLEFSEFNINKLKENNYNEYIEKEITYKQIQLTNNYINILVDDNSKYVLMKKYTFLDTSNCFSFGKYDQKKAKKIMMFKLNNEYLQIPIGFKNDFDNYDDLRKKRKFKYTIEEIKNCLGYIQLYDEQIEAIISCFQNTNGIIDLIGGLGKTEIFLALCKLMNLKTLIITESIDLCTQTYKRAKQAGLNIDIVQGNNVKENQITICTIQSSHKIKDEYEMVIIDECHNISSRYIPIISKNILYRFGFSATPFSKNKLKNAYIKSFLGDIIYNAKTETLIQNKKIAEPIFYIINIEQPKNIYNLNNWNDIEKLGIINNNYRNKKIIDICKNLDTQILILIKKIKHGKILEKMLIEENINCLFIWGSTIKEDREKVIKEFDKNNNKFVLIGSNILKEGISIDSIFNLILAGGGQSYFDNMQSLYRGTRVKLKNQFNVYDFYDKFNRITCNHSEQRIKDYKNKGFTKIFDKNT